MKIEQHQEYVAFLDGFNTTLCTNGALTFLDVRFHSVLELILCTTLKLNCKQVAAAKMNEGNSKGLLAKLYGLRLQSVEQLAKLLWFPLVVNPPSDSEEKKLLAKYEK